MNYSFVRGFKWLIVLTIILVGFSCYKMRSLNLGFDFLGGVKISVVRDEFNEEIIDEIFSELDKKLDKIVHTNRIEIKLSNDELSKIIQKNTTNFATKEGRPLAHFIEFLEERINSDDIINAEYVGPITSKRLLWSGLWAMILSMVAMLLYMSLRFKWNFGVSAILSLFIVIALCTGLISIFDMKLDLNIIAALLAVIGYGVNDVIVVYDRIRENMKLAALGLSCIIDNSIRQTLRRTTFTVLTTLLGNLCLIIFCGDSLKDFSILVFCGILVSTYVSIFLAGPMLTLFATDQK